MNSLPMFRGIWRRWWLVVALLLPLGWWLTKPDGLTHMQAYVGHPSQISSNGRLLVTHDGQIFQLPEGDLLRRITDLGPISISPNGEFVATSTLESSKTVPIAPENQRSIVHIVRVADQSPPVHVRTHLAHIQTMAINSDGTLLALSSGSVGPDPWTIYDIHTGQRLPAIHARNDEVGQLQFTPDGRMLLVQGFTSFRVVDTQSWHTLAEYPLQRGFYSYSATTHIVAVNHDTMIGLLSLHDDLVAPRHIDNPFSVPHSFTFSPDGQYLAVVASNPVGTGMWNIFGSSPAAPVRMALVRVADGAVVQRFEGPHGAMSNPTFTPDGQTIMSIGPGDGLAFWRVRPREPWEQQLRALPFWIAPLFPLIALVRWAMRRWGRQPRG